MKAAIAEFRRSKKAEAAMGKSQAMELG